MDPMMDRALLRLYRLEHEAISLARLTMEGPALARKVAQIRATYRLARAFWWSLLRPLRPDGTTRD